MTKQCKHKMIYGGVKFRNAEKHELPGTGARRRLYFDFYYCEHGCGKKEYQRLKEQNTTYDGVLFNATPIPSKDEEYIITIVGEYFR